MFCFILGAELKSFGQKLKSLFLAFVGRCFLDDRFFSLALLSKWLQKVPGRLIFLVFFFFFEILAASHRQFIHVAKTVFLKSARKEKDPLCNNLLPFLKDQQKYAITMMYTWNQEDTLCQLYCDEKKSI